MKGTAQEPIYATAIADELRPITSTSVRQETRFVDDSQSPVSFAGNFLWIWLGGGLVVAAIYFIFGLIMIGTIILAPFGFQLLKIGQVALFPFGKQIRSCNTASAFEGIFNVVLNVLWLPVGIVLLIWHLIMGIICACTCYGIIFTFQHIKLAKMALFPFGSESLSDRILTESIYTTTTTTSYAAIPPGNAYVEAHGPF